MAWNFPALKVLAIWTLGIDGRMVPKLDFV